MVEEERRVSSDPSFSSTVSTEVSSVGMVRSSSPRGTAGNVRERVLN